MALPILVTGGKGFIGSNFLRFAARQSSFVIHAPAHRAFDLLNVEQMEHVVSRLRPKVVVNFAAFRNATLAERQRGDVNGSAWQTNVVGAEHISGVCRACGAFLVHISTDMVFSGVRQSKGPYSEHAAPEDSLDRLSWYGWTKREAERRLEGNENAAIVRIGNVTQPVYNPTLDYVGKILYLFDRRELYPLFDDQFLTLTPIPLLCRVIEAIVKRRKPGIYHVATSDIFTPYELGAYLLKKMYGEVKGLQRATIAAYLRNAPNRYPQYGGLLTHHTQQELGIAMPRWREVIDSSLSSLHQRIEDAA